MICVLQHHESAADRRTRELESIHKLKNEIVTMPMKVNKVLKCISAQLHFYPYKKQK